MIEQSCPRDLLFVTATQCGMPFPGDIPSTLSLDNMPHLYLLENFQELGVCDASGSHVFWRMRVDHLVTVSIRLHICIQRLGTSPDLLMYQEINKGVEVSE